MQLSDWIKDLISSPASYSVNICLNTQALRRVKSCRKLSHSNIELTFMSQHRVNIKNGTLTSHLMAFLVWQTWVNYKRLTDGFNIVIVQIYSFTNSIFASQQQQ